MLAIGSDPTAGDQQVDMGVIAQLTIPGVEHRQHAGQCPEVPFLGTKVLDRRGRNLHQQTVQQLLVATEHRAQLRRHGDDSVKIVAGQQLGLTLFEPLLGLASMAFGACPITTAVVVPERLIAIVTLVEPSSQLLVQQAAISESAFFCEGIILSPYWATYWGPNWRTMSAKSTLALGGQMLGSTTAGPPSLEEAVGGLEQQLAELVAQRVSEMGIDHGGSQAGVSEQHLDDADIHAPLEHVCGEAVTQRVRSEIRVKAAGVARLDERGACGRIGQVGHRSPAGKEPPPAVVGFPDLAEHLAGSIRSAGECALCFPSR